MYLVAGTDGEDLDLNIVTSKLALKLSMLVRNFEGHVANGINRGR